MATEQDFLAAAASEIGYTESPAGSNRTKFAAEAGHANGYAWCLTFMVAVARRTKTQVPAAVAGTAYTPSAVQAFKNAGKWTTTPKVGAWAFFDFPDNVNRVQHVGVVEKINADGTITTIEGNTSSGSTGSQTNGGGVFRRKRSRSTVVGYGLPDYASDVKPKAVIVKSGSPEAALLFVYPALFKRPVRVLEPGDVPATNNPEDIAFGVAVWGAGTQIRGEDRYETLELALKYLAA